MPRSKPAPNSGDTLLVFSTSIGWTAVLVVGNTVKRLTFGHATAAQAQKALRHGGDAASCRIASKPAAWSQTQAALVRRLRDFADGKPDDFLDVPLDLGLPSQFQRQVLDQCRRIPYGRTLSYMELAAKAGFPGAARAVGNCMAANRIPLMIPCHRVVRADQNYGRFSAPGGTCMKRRLLALESEFA